MTTVGTLSTDLGPGNGDLTGKTSMDLPIAPDNNVPLIVTTAADEDKTDKLAVAPINGEGSISFLQACSKLDMEPNPFEQSFSGLSSDKPGAPPSAAEPAVETPKPVLPPIAAMSGRLAPNSEQFSWDAQSLRMGPLSPSMLEGPQDPVMFEKANTNPIPVGSFPATAAAPISTIFTSGAPLAETGFPFVGMAAPQSMAPSAGPIQTTEPYQPAIYNPSGPNDRQNMSFAQANGQSAMNDRYMPPQGAPNHDGGANGYGNLHLLSQAQATHREMWIKRESVDANGHVHSQHPQAQHAHSGAPQNGQAMSGMHPGMVTAQQPPRNGAEPSSRNNHRNRMTSEDYSDDSEQSMQSSTNGDSKSKKGNGHNDKKRPASDDKMDEEEKRKNFLERNRQAALKCRQRKKQWLTNLQAKVEYLTTDNEHLQTQTASLRDEIIHLKALLLAHKECPVAQSHGVYAETIGNPSAGMMPHGRGPAHSMQGQPLQHQQQQQRGSGPRGALPPPPPPQMQAGGHRMSMGSSSAAAAGSAASAAAAGVHRPMSMMQDITPNASPSQAQATVRY
ncbi:unnamed protein product [Mortierella alpina]